MEAEEMIKLSTMVYNKHFKNCRSIREDLISEGILGIIQAEQNFDESKGLSRTTYACSMAKGKMLTFYNKEKENTSNTFNDHDCMNVQSSIDVKKIINDKERKKHIMKYIESMKEKDRKLVYCVMNGDKLCDLAKEYKVSNQALSVRWKKCKSKIKEEYEKVMLDE